MNAQNPYVSPAAEQSPAPRRMAAVEEADDWAARATVDTVVPRHIAASLDFSLAMLLAVIVAKQFHEDWPMLQLAAALGTIVAYYLIGEALIGRTPGKLLTGLVVVDVSGRSCTWWQAFVRTMWRFLEVNPALLGALPAAVCIVRSKRHQRIGDRAAGTIVAPASRVRQRRLVLAESGVSAG